MGLACGWWTTTTGSACAYVKLNEDGTIGLITGATEIGTGALQAGVAQILAEEMGVPMSDLVLVTSDTDAPRTTSGPRAAARSTTWAMPSGWPPRTASGRSLEFVAGELGCDAAELELVDGRAQVAGDPGRGMTLAEVGLASLWKGGYITGRGSFLAQPDRRTTTSTVHGMLYPAFNEPTFYCHAAEVEVDAADGRGRPDSLRGDARRRAGRSTPRASTARSAAG